MFEIFYVVKLEKYGFHEGPRGFGGKKIGP